MQQVCALLVLLGSAAMLVAETPPVVALPQVLQSKQIDLAKAEIDRVSQMVDAGTLPRIRLDEAQENLADAQDEAILTHTLYGELPVQNLSDQMAEDMVAAAQRRVQRQMKKLDATQKLINDGVIPKSALDPLQEELTMRRMHLNLAHSRSRLIGELVALTKYEHSMQDLQTSAHIEPYTDYTTHTMVHYEGSGAFLVAKDLKVLESSFERHFGRALPISADGQTAVHESLGFDHRGRLDVALNPNEPAGIWLRRYLEAKHVPYYAFLRAIPGQATGAHIHIGPGSTRLHNAD